MGETRLKTFAHWVISFGIEDNVVNDAERRWGLALENIWKPRSCALSRC